MYSYGNPVLTRFRVALIINDLCGILTKFPEFFYLRGIVSGPVPHESDLAGAACLACYCDSFSIAISALMRLFY